VDVEQPDVEFGARPSIDDPVLDRAIALLTAKQAA
jgi:hypothetical protein